MTKEEEKKLKRILIPLLVLALLLCGATASAAGNTMMFDRDTKSQLEKQYLFFFNVS